MFDFLNFKKQVGGIRAQLDSLDKAIETTRNELRYLNTAPLPCVDVVDHFCSAGGLIDKLAGDYDAALENTLSRLFRSPSSLEKADGVGVITAAPTGVQSSPKTMEAAILFLFRDEIKKTFRAKIESMPWPKNAGPRISERPELIRKTESELSALEKELDTLRCELAASKVII